MFVNVDRKLIVKSILITLLLFQSFMFLFLCSDASGSQYTPEGLYDPEYVTLNNGLDVVLKKRDVTHNVSIRLAMDINKLY